MQGSAGSQQSNVRRILWPQRTRHVFSLVQPAARFAVLSPVKRDLAETRQQPETILGSDVCPVEFDAVERLCLLPMSLLFERRTSLPDIPVCKAARRQ